MYLVALDVRRATTPLGFIPYDNDDEDDNDDDGDDDYDDDDDCDDDDKGDDDDQDDLKILQ